MTIPGLMQTTPLLISSILRYGAAAHAGRPIVSRLVDEPLWRYDFAGLAARAAKAAHALAALGVKSGDRVTSLAWNTHRHLELFYAVPGVCRTTRSSTRSITRKAGSCCSTAPSFRWSSA